MFQVLLICSGNLSFLNWLTIIPSIALFDDTFLAPFFPAKLRLRVEALQREDNKHKPRTKYQKLQYYLRLSITLALLATVAFLSINPVKNLMSTRQAMNTSYDRFNLVNTYGAFGKSVKCWNVDMCVGSVGQHRGEIIIEGTMDSQITANTKWLEYEFKCKPGNVSRRPCVAAPYHYRIDWQVS